MKPAVVTEYNFKLRKPLKTPLKIAHVSDIHERDASDVLELLKKAKPDLVLITGDTYERYGEDRPHYNFAGRPFAHAAITVIYKLNKFFYRFTWSAKHNGTEYSNRFLCAAKKCAPVFLSRGNHEENLLDSDLGFLKAHGMVMLDNSDTEACIKGERLLIGGLSPEADLNWLENFSAKSGVKLLLCHHPEFYDEMLADKDIDLILAGHTHGGQIRLFGRGLFAPYQGALPKYDWGLFDGRMIVSAGCSNTTAVPRIGNPRELVIINLS